MTGRKTDNEVIDQIVRELTSDHDCHTVILYGSRARGAESIKSDYDVMGVCRRGKKFRIAEKREDYFLDAFIFPEKDLEKLGESHLYMKDAKILYQKGKYGSLFIKRLNTALKRQYKPLPDDEIKVRREWAHKMLDRTSQGDIEALYRRSWLHMALLEDYFAIRRKRYWGSKAAFAWLKEHDKNTYNKFSKMLRNPQDLMKLRSLVEAVSMLKPNRRQNDRSKKR